MLRQRRIILTALLLVLSALVIGCHENQKDKKKNTLKNHLSRNHMLYEAATLWKYSPYLP